MLSPADAALIDIIGLVDVDYNWQLAPSLIPNDTTNYFLFLSETYPFTEGEAFYTNSVTEAGTLSVPADEIPLGIPVYWKVMAENRLGFTNWSESIFSNTYYMRGDMVINRSIDITDLVFLVTYMFSSGPAPQIMETADINCSLAGPDISDLVYMVSYMFSEGDPIGCN